jgi:hypothetical protein
MSKRWNQKETNNVRHHPTLRPSRPVLATLPENATKAVSLLETIVAGAD